MTWILGLFGITAGIVVVVLFLVFVVMALLLTGQCDLGDRARYGYCDIYSGDCLESNVAEVHAPVWLDDFHILFYLGGSGA